MRVLVAVGAVVAAAVALVLGVSHQTERKAQPPVSSEARPGGARQLLEQAQKELERNPHAAHWHSESSVAHALLADLAAAEMEMEQAIRNDLENPIYYFHLAGIREKRGNVPGALVAIRRAVDRDPNNPSGHCDLAYILERTGELSGALSEYELCLQNLRFADAEASVYYDPRKNAYGTKGLRDFAETHIRRLKTGAKLQTPRLPKSQQQDCVPWQAPCPDTDPRDLLNKAREQLLRDPHAARWHREAAWAYYLLGDSSMAQKKINEAIRSDPRITTSYYLAAFLSEKRGDASSELSFLRQALALDPRNPLGHFRLGDALERSGQLERALEHFLRCAANLSQCRHPGHIC